MHWLKNLLVLAVILVAFNAHADRNIYAVIGAGYAQNELQDEDIDSFSYKLGLAYELSEQWYLEAGFQSFADENAGDLPLSANDPSAELSGLYLSALGKADGRYGELFYRLGAVYIDATYTALANASSCPGEQTLFTSNDVNYCEFDEGIVAGQLGLGFDFYLTATSLLRAEVEWTKGQDDFETAALYLGLRVNF